MIGGMLAVPRTQAVAEADRCSSVTPSEQPPHDVCAIVVSHNGKHWLDDCLDSLFAHAGDVDLEAIVVDNGDDGSATYVEERFPAARTLRCPNRGFGHANNRALEIANARYLLFLNPDTEVLEGSLAELVANMDRWPRRALLGVRQLRADGSLAPSIRRFPSLPNMLAEALGVERVPGLRHLLGERVLSPRRYEREGPCDWTSGSFMLVRRAALEQCGAFDERFFLYSEETDLCWRLKEAGWEVTHMPLMTICHYEDDRRGSPALEAQAVYSRMQFARKHFHGGALGYRWALGLRYALRSGGIARGGRLSGRRRAARAALRMVLAERPPFGEPPQATIVSAPGSIASSSSVRSPM
jgi:GT2 family glycosyltransferase